MEIEFKQEECKNKEKMYQVGNVIEDDGSVFLVWIMKLMNTNKVKTTC